jgi:ribokinase
MRPEVFCLGAVNLELTYLVDDLPGFFREWSPGPARDGTVVLSNAAEERLEELLSRRGRLTGKDWGGRAPGAAWALARLGLNAALLGRVGEDADGAFLLENLAGVNLDYLIRGGRSGRTYLLTDPAGARAILEAPHTNGDLTPGDIPPEPLARGEFLLLTLFPGERLLQTQDETARKSAASPRLVLDPGELRARRGWQALEVMLDQVETLLVTEREWQLLGGEPKVHPHWAPPLVVIKRGSLGARLLTPPRYLDFPVELVPHEADINAAGDVFAAGYLAGRISGLHLNLALRLANRAAAVSLKGPGRESYPDAAFLERQVAHLRRT